MPVNPLISPPSAGSPAFSRCSAYAFSAMPSPPRSPMFSPIVSDPLTVCSSPRPTGESASYWAMRFAVRSSNAARSSAVHQSLSAPVPS